MSNRFKPRLTGWSIDPVLRRLAALAALSDTELALVRGLADRRFRSAPGEDLLAGGDSGPRPRFVLAGWAALLRALPDGRCQIFRFVLPGDLLEAPSRGGRLPLWSVAAMTALETVDATRAVEAAAAGRAPGIEQALTAMSARDEELLFDHMVRLGQQTAYERLAHFLLELQRRLQLVGLGDAQRFPLPLTQEMLADALGLSIVHINRTLQQLRRDGLIELRSGVAILLDPAALLTIAGHDAPRPLRPASSAAHKASPAAARVPA